MEKTQIAIIGAGPAGLTLALLLHRASIACKILELRSRQYAESRVRAGLLEQNTVDLYQELGVAQRLNAEGLLHHGVCLSFDEDRIRIPFSELTGGRCITIYGQQEVVKDLIAACMSKGIEIEFEACATAINNIESSTPSITYTKEGEIKTLHAGFVAACDGFHGIGRKTMPAATYNQFEKNYPFSWLGILSHTTPSSHELIYAYHQRGFALSSLRSEKVSRLYIQVDNNDHISNWSDDQIWDELALRLHTEGFTLNRGEIFEKTITPMRSFMIDNMQFGRLYLAGDAAHIVPPTGGKGLNLAIADVRWLAAAFIYCYHHNSEEKLRSYTADCLRRIWRAQDFSNFMTMLFHKQHEHGSFEYQLQKAKFNYLKTSPSYATTIAENYVGLREI